MNWIWPLRGLLDLAVRPKLWRAVIGGSWLANLVIILVALGSLLWYWPFEEAGLNWREIGLWGMTVSGTFVLLVPLMRGKAGRAVMFPYLEEHGRPVEGLTRGIGGQIVYTFKTLPLRVLWILAALGAAQLHPLLGVVVSALAVGHLSVIDALDQALIACGCEAEARRRLRGPLFGELLFAGLAAAAMFSVATISVFGCLVLIPAIFIGAADYAHRLAPMPASEPDVPAPQLEKASPFAEGTASESTKPL